jgi:hypothetical protein
LTASPFWQDQATHANALSKSGGLVSLDLVSSFHLFTLAGQDEKIE